MGRGLRSFTVGFTTVVFPLYLAHSGYNAVKIGEALAAAALIGALLFVFVGFGGDRFGRRTIMIVLSLFSVVGSLGLALSSSISVVMLSSGLGGIGRGGGAGSGGAWGPLFPAEMPLLSESTPPGERTRVFGRLSFIGVMAAAGGSLAAGIPTWLHAQGWTWIAGYRLLFFAAAVLSCVMVATILPIRELSPRPVAVTGTRPPAASIRPRQLLGRLGVINGLNGLGFGFLGPLLTYWFYRRFGVGPAELGVLYAIINVATAFPYLSSHWVTRRLGPVRTVAYTRLIAAALLLVMAAMPTFLLTGIVYTFRMMFNSLGMPARQSWVMGASEEHMRSRMAALSSLPAQATSMISPAIGGALMGTFLDIPIFGAAFFFSLNALGYFFAFRNVTLREETENIAEVPP